MKTVVIANPAAAAGRVRRQWHAIYELVAVRFEASDALFTSAPGQATALARQAMVGGAKRIVVVGGDGTVNEVVNGIFSEPERKGEPNGREVVLVVFPVGTGGDFARSIGLSVRDVAAALANATERRVDIGRMTLHSLEGEEISHHFINIASFGASGVVVDKVNQASKRFGAKASFYAGTIKGLLAYRNQPVLIQMDDASPTQVIINTVAIANGRYFGGAMKIAPEAELDDGLFDVTVVGDIGLTTFLRYSGRLYRGTHLGLKNMRAFRGRTVTAQALGREPVLVEADGELIGRLPLRAQVLPGALRLLAPWGSAEGITAKPKSGGK